MAGLSAAGLASARKAFEAVLPDRCTIQRPSTTVDTATGDWTQAPATVVDGVPCRVDAGGRSAIEAILAGRPQSEGYVTVTLSAAASRWPGGVVDVKATDTLVVTGGGAGTYQPISAGGPVTDEMLREVVCQKMEI